MKTVCIMGGGLGGLMTGALLAKEGYRVTVLEKNRIIGGGLQSFRRGPYTFDTGMHVFGGMGTDGQVRRICRHLGIEDRLETVPCYDTLMDAESGRRVTLPFGRNAWTYKWSRSLESIMPGVDVSREIDDYLDKLYDLTQQEPLYSLRQTTDDYTLPDTSLTAKKLIEDSINNPLLRTVMAYLSIFYGGREDSPALLHALIGCAHINGTYTFRNGSIGFANLLAEVVTANGGEVRCGEEVTDIATEGRAVTAVYTTAGTYTADHYINDMPIARLLELMPTEAFSPAFRRRIGSAPYTMSALTVFIGLKPRSLCYNREAYFSGRMNMDMWQTDACSEADWPNIVFALPCEDKENPGFASTITAVCPMSYDFVRQWEDSRTGRRPDEYYRWKERMTQQALKMLEPIGFEVPMKEAIAFIDSGTPLTIRDYYGTPRGAMYGIHRSSDNPLQSSLSPHTRLNNLLLTGQDVNFHGMVGTSLTAILTAEAIVGRNIIVEQINKE